MIRFTILITVICFSLMSEARSPRKFVMEFSKFSDLYSKQTITISLSEIDMDAYPFGDPSKFDCLPVIHMDNNGQDLEYVRHSRYGGKDVELAINSDRYMIPGFYLVGMGGFISHFHYAADFLWKDKNVCLTGKRPDKIIIGFSDDGSTGTPIRIGWKRASDEVYALTSDNSNIGAGKVLEWWP